MPRFTRRLPLFVLFILLAARPAAQDLVINGGFEAFSECPERTGQIARATPWAISGGTPDLFNRCADPTGRVGIPTNFFGRQEPRAGDGYAGLIFAPGDIGVAREFMTTGLREPLVAGACYYLEFYVSFAELSREDCNGFGVLVSETIPELQLLEPPRPDFNYRRTVNDEEGWTLISGTLTASGGERFLAIGNFDGCNGRETARLPFIYYYIDEIKLFLIDEEATRDIYFCDDSDDCYVFNDVDYCDAGTYQIPLGDVTQPGCPDTVTLNIFRDQPLTVSIDEMPEYDCSTETYRLGVINPNNVRDLVYAWTGPGGFTSALERPIVSLAGTYELTASNGGCSTTDTYELRPVEAGRLSLNLFQSGDLSCTSPSATLSSGTTAAGLTYRWSGPNFASSDSAITVTVPGTYTVTISQPGQPCTATDSIAVPFDDGVASPVILQTGTLNCALDSVTLTAVAPVAGLTYRWTGPAGPLTDTTLTVTEAGTYVLTVGSGPGCTASSEVTLTRPPPLTARAVTRDYRCPEFGGAVFITETSGGTPPYLYGLAGAGALTADTAFTNLLPGGYGAIVEDAAGCTARLTNLSVRQLPPPEVVLPDVPLLPWNDSLRLTPLLSFPAAEVGRITWLPTDQLSCTDCLRPVLTARRPTVLSVVLELRDGCTLTDSVSVRVVPAPNRLYLPSAFSPGRVDGVNDRFTVYAEVGQPASVLEFDVFDRWGAQVYGQRGGVTNDPASGWDGRSGGRASPAGVYVYALRVRFPDGTVEERAGSLVLIR